MLNPRTPAGRRPRSASRGVTLIVVLILLVIVTIVGIAGARIALLGERSTRFDRDYQIAWEAAEAALIDAEYDIAGPNASSASRVASFGTTMGNVGAFRPGCGTDTATRGLCSPLAAGVTKPIWRTVDMVGTDDNASNRPYVKFGEMTGRNYPSGSAGVQPALLPHYIIEYVTDERGGGSAGSAVGGGAGATPILYRITAIGFGPNQQTQVMMQSTYGRNN